MNDSKAITRVPIHPPIASRWSPRAFSSKEVPSEDLLAMLEAARWAPSCFGAEPWRFVIGIRGRGEGHAAIASTLVPGNQVWAERAPVLMITMARDRFEYNDAENRWASHDLGLAMGQFSIEASARGFVLHQMGGFDVQAARKIFAIPEGFTPLAAVAIGLEGDPKDLPPELAERESAPRTRKALEELAFEGAFGTPVELS